jgi:hypothetical protein
VITVDDAASVLADPTACTDEVWLRTALSQLRTHAPVAYPMHPAIGPFGLSPVKADVVAARMEITSSSLNRCPPLEKLELNGEAELTPTTFAGGLKRLPIRYALK